MNFKKINKILEKAEKNYKQNFEEFSSFLNNKTEFIPLNYLMKINSKKDFDKTVKDFNKKNLQNNLNQNLDSNIDNNFENVNRNNYNNDLEHANFPQVNILSDGKNPNTPINIIAKNYINPESFNEFESENLNLDEKKSNKLAKIPNKLIKKATTNWEPINYKGVDDNYHLYKLSSVKISYDDVLDKLVYEIREPILDKYEKDILEELKKAFICVFERIPPKQDNLKEEEIIVEGAKKLCIKYGIKLNQEQFEKITYFLERDFLGLEKIEAIMHDPYVEDVSCDGLNVPIFVNHLKYGPLETNVEYKDNLKLNSFIVKLAQKSNQEVSLSKPILQGALPDGSRIEAIYGKEVSEKGSSFTIRKFRSEPMTPIHLIELGTMPSFLLAYLWLSVENKQSILVSGGTATGKTTILNALSLFVPPTSKIVSIEDTPEINLPHKHWLPLISRENDDKSEVSMFDLLKASLRERPDYIIVGEIRGKEAAILFQGMATGHAGLGTVHAEKFNDLVNRMTIDPINLPKQLLTELNICLFQKQIKVKDNAVRRTTSVVEILDYNQKSDKFLTNEFLKFKPMEDSFEFCEKSLVISHLLEIRGGEEDSLWTEIEKRRRILDLMYDNKILDFREVSKIIKAYYKDPSQIFSFIEDFIEKNKNNKN